MGNVSSTRPARTAPTRFGFIDRGHELTLLTCVGVKLRRRLAFIPASIWAAPLRAISVKPLVPVQKHPSGSKAAALRKFDDPSADKRPMVT